MYARMLSGFGAINTGRTIVAARPSGVIPGIVEGGSPIAPPTFPVGPGGGGGSGGGGILQKIFKATQALFPTCTPDGCITCTSSQCTATGSWRYRFVELQQLLNAGAAATGMSARVVVDSVIRQDTADLVSALGVQWPPGPHVMIWQKLNPRYVASNVQMIINNLLAMGLQPGGSSGGGGVLSTDQGQTGPGTITTTGGGSGDGGPIITGGGGGSVATTGGGDTSSGGPPTSSDGTLLPAGPSATVSPPMPVDTTTLDTSLLSSLSDAPIGYKIAAGAAVLAAVAVGVSVFRRHRKLA